VHVVDRVIGVATGLLNAAQMPPSRRSRVIVALACGLAAAAGTAWSFRYNPQWGAHDYGYAWVAGRAVLDGESPYTAVKDPKWALPWDPNFKYPMPTAVVAAPLALLPMRPSGVVFSGLSFAWLAFALSRFGWWRLGVLGSGPAIYAARSGQWSPFVVAAALTTGLEWLMVVKPNLAVALFVSRPRWRTAIGAALACVVSLLFLPSWPWEWLGVAWLASQYQSIGLQLAGMFALFAALRWRTPEGRLLLAMSILPINSWIYDGLPLLLVARTPRELATMAVPSGALTLAFILEFNALGFPADLGLGSLFARYIMIATVFLPATIIVLRHPNIGSLPAWAERATRRAPAWLRGAPV
jgi:hypothetical protein